MKEFNPRLDILPAAQIRLWSELSSVPEEFVLYGGTALALHELPNELKQRLVMAAREVDLDRLPNLTGEFRLSDNGNEP